MAGTITGGMKAKETNKEKYGADYYANIGRIGGKKGTTGGFYYMKQNGQLEKVRAAGRKGGRISRRGK